MIEVRRIILVNWYAFGSEEIELRGDTAFVGDNGAGKSSVLDAVQLALTGGDKRYFRPNARADDGKRGGRRTVRDYCLGKVAGVEDAEPLRKGGTSYVVLVASDPGGATQLSFGIALYAEPGLADAETEGLFIATGVQLRATDLHGGGGGGAAAAWAEARHGIGANCRERGGSLHSFDQPSAFIRSLLQHTRGRHGEAHPDHWLRAMRMAASFRGLESPDDFVRDFILPENPINLPALREDVRRYREIVALIKKLEEQERNLTVVHGAFEDHFAAVSQVRTAAALGALARHQQAADRVTTGAQATERYERERDGLAALLDQGERELEACQDRVQQARNARDGDPAQARLAQAKLAYNEAVARSKDISAKLKSVRDAIKAVYEALLGASTCGVPVGAGLGTFKEAFDPDAGEGWPRNIQAALAAWDALGGLADVQSRLGDAQTLHARAAAQANEAFRAAVATLDDARRGGFRLRGETRALLDALAAEGMDPVPLCSVAKVTDDEWAQAAETLLGAGRDAVLVERHQVRDAIRVMRSGRARFHDCTVVQVGGMERHGGKPRADSLAAVVATNDPRARAFLNLRLGGITRVRTEAELEVAGRAVTPDCQYASGGGVQNRRPVQDLILGRRWTEADIAHLTRERDAAAENWQRTEAKAKGTGRAGLLLEGATAAMANAGGLEALAAERAKAGAAVTATTLLIEDAEHAVPADLARRVGELERELGAKRAERQATKSQNDLMSGTLARATVELEKARDDLGKAGAALDALDCTSDERAAAASELTQRLQDRDGLSAILDDAAHRVQTGGRKAERLRTAADDRLNEYWRRYGEHPADAPKPSAPALDSTASKALWVSQRLARLAGHELRRHKEAAEHAEARVSEGLRQDLFLTLASRVDEGERLRGDLNRHLRKRPFHGEIYAFQRTAKPEFEDVLRAAEAVRRDGALAGGYSPAVDEVVDRGRRRVLALLDDDGPAADAEVERLADYRRYFTYDVEMRSEATGALMGRLSQRLRTGSGGEREAPSYAAVGTALAAANTIQPGAPREDIGMALAVFDEAFTRLDDANIGSVLDLMRTLGLQLLVAAPTSKWFAFASRFETLVQVVRINRAVTLVTHHTDEGFRAKLRADNPFDMTLDQWDARNGQQHATG